MGAERPLPASDRGGDRLKRRFRRRYRMADQVSRILFRPCALHYRHAIGYAIDATPEVLARAIGRPDRIVEDSDA